MRAPIQILAGLTLWCAGLAAQTDYTIHTVAGGGLPDGVRARAARLGESGISGVAVGGADLYIALGSHGAVMRMDADGILWRIAGTGMLGFTPADGPALRAEFSKQLSIAADNSGTLYVADGDHGVVRKVSQGRITTVAGGGASRADGIPATSAALISPQAVALDGAGNLYIAEAARVRKVSGGTITTVAGTGHPGFGGDGGPAQMAGLGYYLNVAADAAGTVYILDKGSNRVRMVSDGVISTVAGGSGPQGIDGPALSVGLSLSAWYGGIVTDAAGNVYFSESGRIRRLSGGMVTTIAGVGPVGVGWDYDIGDYGPALAAKFGFPAALAFDAAGDLYVADESYGSARVRKISHGIVTTIAGGGQEVGDGGAAPRAMLDGPADVAVDSHGIIHIAEKGSNRIRTIRKGVIVTTAGNGSGGPPGAGVGGRPTEAPAPSPANLTASPSGELYFSFYSGILMRAAGELLSGPLMTTPGSITDLATDGAGNLYVLLIGENRVDRFAGGVRTTVAGSGSRGYSGDGGPATEAEFDGLWGMTATAAGDLYIADQRNAAIRQVRNGTITTVAQVRAVNGVAADDRGNLFASTGQSIAKVVGGKPIAIAGGGTSSGEGGPAVDAALYYVSGLALDAGILYVADAEAHCVRALIPRKDDRGLPFPRVVSAANFEWGPLAAGSMGTVFGAEFTTRTAEGNGALSLAGMSIGIRDAKGVEWAAPLFFVSPEQANFLIPQEAAPGRAEFRLQTATGATLAATIEIVALRPGLFALNRDGLAAATVLRVRADQTQSAEAVYTVRGGVIEATPIDLGPPTDSVYLILYGTGLRAAGTEAVQVHVDGIPARVMYAGPSSSAGQDQINVLIPRSAAGRGIVPVYVSAQGLRANLVHVTIR